jgi:hypothetical protein
MWLAAVALQQIFHWWASKQQGLFYDTVVLRALEVKLRCARIACPALETPRPFSGETEISSGTEKPVRAPEQIRL